MRRWSVISRMPIPGSPSASFDGTTCPSGHRSHGQDGSQAADCSSCGECPASCAVHRVPAPANPLYFHRNPHPIGCPTICRLHHTTSQQHKVACIQPVPRSNSRYVTSVMQETPIQKAKVPGTLSNRSHKCFIFSPSLHHPLSSAIRPCHASLGSH